MFAKLLSLWLFFNSLSFVFAQFQFFEHMFGNQQRQPSGPGQWAAQADAVPCSQYLCPDSLVCVATPSQCPCPDPQDIKCLIPDVDKRLASQYSK
ncbi:Long chronological lifespan protein 2 [Abortiporus biennis]